MNKQETIKHLTDLMATIQNAYYKGRMNNHPLWVHEVNDDSNAISIDLYHFEGDGKPVCDGLKPCTVTFDDGTVSDMNVFCMGYGSDEVTPLWFLASFMEDDELSDIAIEPELLPEQTLTNVAEWLSKAMQPVPKEKKSNNVTSFMFYMWNRWSKEECKHIYGIKWEHFWDKWLWVYKRLNGPHGAAEVFYSELSTGNRNKLVERALECYDGMDEK